jgi:2-methylcitrate dehydratase PrpD
VLGLAASLEPGELALDVPGEIQPRVRERRAHAGETLLHEGPQEGLALTSNFDGTRHAPGRCRGFAFKRWPAHTAMQIAISAALPLHRAGHIPGEVRIAAPPLRYCDRPSPRDSDDARFSFQLNVAQALLDGSVDQESFTDARLARPALQALLRRTRLDWDMDIPTDFTAMEVRVHLDDGRSSRADRWPGHWKSPASDAALLAKFLECAAARYEAKDARALAAALGALPGLPDLSPLLALLGRARPLPARA